MDNNRIASTEDDLKLSNKITRNIQHAADSWVNNNNSGGRIPDNSEHFQELAEKALKTLENTSRPWNIKIKKIVSLWLDWGVGLYPTFETDYLDQNGEAQHNTQYTGENFFKFINGFWN